MKIYLKALGIIGIGVLVLTLILTIFDYFNLLSLTAVNVIKLLIAISSIVVGGYVVGKASLKKGWLEGLKLALIIIVILALITLIFRLGFSTKTLIYYAIVIASSTVGSMIGISNNEKKK